MNDNTKQIPYESPSGYVTLYNYKEPFMKFERGYGFQGVLLMDSFDTTVQCHLCGKWFDSLGQHVFRVHGIKAKEYKVQVGLRKNASLLSEKLREKIIQVRKNSLAFQEVAEKLRSYQHKEREKTEFVMTREFQNKRGTCPMQLIDRIKTKAEELGRTPTAIELEKVISKKTVKAVFGSMENAIKIAGLSPRKKGEGVTYKTYGTKEEVLAILQNFKESKGRMPTMGDSKRGLIPSWGTYVKYFGSFNNAKKELV